MRKWFVWLLVLVMASLTLVGCAKPVEKIVEVPVEKIVEKPMPVDEGKILADALTRALAALPADFAQIDPLKLKERIDANAPMTLIDVRNPSELTAGTLANSINIPIHDLGKSLSQLPADKNAPIVFYCAVGVRGSMATMALRNLGYTNVVNLKGGFGAWNTAGLPVIKK